MTPALVELTRKLSERRKEHHVADALLELKMVYVLFSAHLTMLTIINKTFKLKIKFALTIEQQNKYKFTQNDT